VTNLESPPTGDEAPRPGRYGRWRAGTLILVHVLMVLHFVHWRIAGRTLAPLEFSEGMITLELGIITAGFLFMLLAVLSAVIFGRFFCSWGCHILALEDLCAWLLKKVGIRPRPVRSRVLLLAPPAAFFYMFLWPQVKHLLAGTSAPEWRLAGEGEAWASFITEDYWHQMPSAGVAILTFLVCGFLVVYVLGSRSFCRYVCPYGAVLALADRVAPGRIVRAGDCDGCGQCTAACQSGVDVHGELDRYGMVVDPGCLKALDCVGACPNGAIGFRFARPSLFRAVFSAGGTQRRKYSFSLVEDAFLGGVFLLAFFVFRGLYGLVPFLLALTLAAIFGYLALVGTRLLTAESVKEWRIQLKVRGRLTRAGAALAPGLVLLCALFVHSTFVRTHEWLGRRAHARISPEAPAVALVAREHLEVVERWGLLHTPGVDRLLGALYLSRGEPELAEPYLRRRMERAPADDHNRLHLARALFGASRLAEAEELVEGVLADEKSAPGTAAEAAALLGSFRASRDDVEGAITAYSTALQHSPDDATAHRALGELLSAQRRFEEAVAHLETALSLEPDVAPAQYNLAVLLAELGRESEAIERYRLATGLDPTDPDSWNNLGFLLAKGSALGEAERCFRQAIELDESLAAPHFNLGLLLSMQGREAEAEVELARAARLDPRYADALPSGR